VDKTELFACAKHSNYVTTTGTLAQRSNCIVIDHTSRILSNGVPMNHGSTLSAAQKLWSAHARRFPAEYPNRERFLATIHGADKGAAETAVRVGNIISRPPCPGACHCRAAPTNPFMTALTIQMSSARAIPIWRASPNVADSVSRKTRHHALMTFHQAVRILSMVQSDASQSPIFERKK
jgi:hypothetical protein